MRSFDAKRPGERRTLTFEFGPDLPSGASIASAGAPVVTLYRGVSASDLVCNGSPVVSGSDVLQSVEGGSAGADYLVVMPVTLSDGQVLELPARLPVRTIV